MISRIKTVGRITYSSSSSSNLNNARYLINSNNNTYRYYSSSNNNNNNNNSNAGDSEGSKSKKSDWKRYTPLLIGGVALIGSVSFLQESKDEKIVKVEPQQYTVKSEKERIVVLGTGWSSLAFIHNIDLEKYEVIVVSPRNFFLFTPMLASTIVGSLEVRSIIEPIRRILKRLTKSNTKYIEAECTEINYKEGYVVIKDVTPLDGKRPEDVKIPFDKLVIAVGSIPNTMGTKGVEENCLYLKEASDAASIRTKIMDCFERASFPNQPLSEIKRLLQFVIVGGGPTGVESAGEINDFIYDDLVKLFPDLIKHCQITLVQSADHLLNTYDVKISEHTEKVFARANIKTIFNSRVVEVQQNQIKVLNKSDKKTYEVPFGLCLWATGVGPRPLTKQFCDSIPEQSNNRAISTDVFLRVIGIPTSNIYAIGDCSTINQSRLLDHIVEMFKEADVNKDDKLSIQELVDVVGKYTRRYPQLETYVKRLPEAFKEFDVNHDGFLQLDEFKRLVEQIDSNLTSLPATAQVANQQGKYLAQQLNNHYGKTISIEDDQSVPTFKYKHLGSFAYVGNRNAVADIPSAGFTGGGFGVWWAYRSVYLSKQFSLKNFVLVGIDWTKSILFGRDVSRL